MKSRLILVADHSAITRRIVREMLVRQGFRVLEAGNMAVALRVVARFGSRLNGVVAESTPPGGSGYDLAAEIGRAAPHGPLLAMSNPTLHLIGGEPLMSRCPTAIRKPFTQALLLERLGALLAQPVRYKTAAVAS